MDALAEIWSRSGHRPENLYKGKTDKIVKELEAWIVARKTRNETNMELLWDLFDSCDTILEVLKIPTSLRSKRNMSKT